MSQQSNNQSDNQSDSEETSYLKEAVRLSELLITGQNSTFAAIERKATLLVTLYIAIIAYLLSWVVDSDNKVTIIMSFIVIFILVIAACIGAYALLTIHFRIPGADPTYLRWKGFNHNFDNMATNLLDEYNDFLVRNKETLDKKSTYLESSLQWGKAGILLTCIWIILVFCYKLGVMP